MDRVRAGSWGAAVLITVALAGTLLGGGRIGHATAAFDGGAWLWSRVAGEVGRVNPDNGRVELRRPVADARGHRVQLIQNDRHLLVHDLDLGRVSSLELGGTGVSGRTTLDPRSDPRLAVSGTAAVVIERVSGQVRAVDPATLRPVGPILRLPGPLVGGEFDGTGLLWVAVPGQGTIAAIKAGAQGAAVARTVEVAEPGRDLALTVLDEGALVVDRGGRDLVVVSRDSVRRVAAAVPLAGAMVPDRTHGALSAITVPAAGVVVTLADGRTGGQIGSFVLSDPVQEPAVAFAGKVYVPVRETGQVRVYDSVGRQTGVLSMPGGRGELELRVREGNLFINAPGRPYAQVVGADGVTRAVGKYPDGTGQGGNPTAPPGAEPGGPPPVAAPPANPGLPGRPDPLPPPAEQPDDRDRPEPDPSAAIPPPAPRPPAPRPPALNPPGTSAPGTRTPSVSPTTRAPAPSPSMPRPKPPPASQAPNPYTPTQVCNSGSGGGYKVQRSSSFKGGRIYQLYSATTKKNCAVTMKTADVGKGTNVWVRLEEQRGGEVATDRGTFKYYAGPVYVHAPGVCVRYSGGAAGASTSIGWANCG